MALKNACIAYGSHWSTPFARWQGSLSQLNSVELAAATARRVLAQREISPAAFDAVVLGVTVPQRASFYGAPWLASMIGAPGVTGPMVAQACATSARALQTAAHGIETGESSAVLVVTCDRTSNGPHLYYPNPSGPGGMGEAENWVWDNFNADPNTGLAMIRTAENVAREAGITTEEQHEMTLLRYRQYQDALADDRAFQRRYMVGVEIGTGKKKTLLEADEGIFPTTADGLARLRPVLEGGTVTFGAQTFPADGNAGLVVAHRERVRDLSRADAPLVTILGFGQARVEKAFMPRAVVPAAMGALKNAGIGLADVKAIKTHNPFAVNDIWFCRQTGVAPEAMNRFGSPLIYGHPQAPTGLRAILELIEELVLAGGGCGLFSGCAAGDTAMAVVLRVG